MRNIDFRLPTILLLTLVPTLFLCFNYISLFEEFETTSGTINVYENFADSIERGDLSNEEIIIKLRNVAKAEKGIIDGFSLMKLSIYFWSLLFIVITIAQGLLLRGLLNTHNKKQQPTT